MQTSDSSEWWAGIGDEPVGPLSAADLRARWEAGEITPATLVWRDGFADWKPASEVPEIAALRPPPASPGGWKPSAGSALAALAGAELDALRQRRAQGPSGNPRLDAFTGAASSAAPKEAATGPDPAHGPAPHRKSPEPSVRWSAASSAAGTFAMGAAVAVALFVAFRGDRVTDATAPPATRAASSVPTPVAAAPVQEPPATPAAAPATRAETPASTPSTSNGEVKPAPAVRASDPPGEKDVTAAAAKRTSGEQAATAKKAPPPPARAARAPAEPRRPVAAAPPATPKRTATAPLDTPPAPAVAPPTPQRATSSDPLASLVTDDDLDRELGGAANRPARTSGSARAAAPSAGPVASAQRSQPGSGDSAVYVPPAPGGDLPDGVTPAQINDAVKTQLGSLRSCIDEQRAADPASKGTLKLRWVIAGDGSVKDVRNLSPEFEGKPISRCIGGVVRDIHFPASRTSGQEVVFPFKF